MAITMVFYIGIKPIVTLGVSCREFDNEILSNVSDEDYKKCFSHLDENDEQVVTDKECIIKIWNSCIDHDFISENLGLSSRCIDSIKILY